MKILLLVAGGWCALVPAFLYGWYRLCNINRHDPKPPMIYGKPRLVRRMGGAR